MGKGDCGIAHHSEMRKVQTMRSNFILFTTDQQRADHVGCYGNPVLRTPHIDSIAATGQRFDHFYVASPVCMANRASLMTGCMPSVHGVRSNGIPLPLRRTTMCDLLRAAGYHTALIGKAHLQNMTGRPPEAPRPQINNALVPPPYELSESEKGMWADGSYENEDLRCWSQHRHNVERPYYGFDHVEICTMHGDVVHGDYYWWLKDRVADADSLRGPNNAAPDERYVLPQAYRTRVPEELYPTRYIEERTLAYLDQAADAHQPFMLHCSFPDPHHPFTPPGRYWNMYDPAQISVPPSLAHNGKRTPAVEALHRERRDGTANVNSTTPFAVTEREAREAIALTYGMIAMIDDAIGNILSRLAKLGLSENTVIIFTSDHGDFMGDHGLMLKAALHYRGLIRVPFIWCDPQISSPGTIGMPASTIDIAPTILERAGLAAYWGIQGESLLSTLRGAPERDRTVIVEEDGHAPTFGLSIPVRARSAVTQRHRLTIYAETDWVELYDLEADPHEITNLDEEVSAISRRADMFERLARRLTELADRQPFPTGRA